MMHTPIPEIKNWRDNYKSFSADCSNSEYYTHIHFYFVKITNFASDAGCQTNFSGDWQSKLSA